MTLHLYQDRAPLNYVVSTPPTHESEAGPWPVLCFLHGNGEAEPLPIFQALTRHGPLRPGSSQRATDCFIVVFPHLKTPGGDVWRGQAAVIRQIVAMVQRDFRGDPQRTYLTGFSYGGNGVLDLAPDQPDLWAALWPVDPTRPPQRTSPRPIWLSSGEYSRRNERGFISALQLQQADLDPDGDRLLRDLGADHGGTALWAYHNDAVYDWLLARRLPSPGRRI